MDKEELQITLLGVGGALVLLSCGLLLPLAAIGVVIWWLSGKGRADPPTEEQAEGGGSWKL